MILRISIFLNDFFFNENPLSLSSYSPITTNQPYQRLKDRFDRFKKFKNVFFFEKFNSSMSMSWRDRGKKKSRESQSQTRRNRRFRFNRGKSTRNEFQDVFQNLLRSELSSTAELSNALDRLNTMTFPRRDVTQADCEKMILLPQFVRTALPVRPLDLREYRGEY